MSFPKSQNQHNKLLGSDQHQARNLEDELTLAMQTAIIALGVDQLENLTELRRVGHLTLILQRLMACCSLWEPAGACVHISQVQHHSKACS